MFSVQTYITYSSSAPTKGQWIIYAWPYINTLWGQFWFDLKQLGTNRSILVTGSYSLKLGLHIFLSFVKIRVQLICKDTNSYCIFKCTIYKYANREKIEQNVHVELTSTDTMSGQCEENIFFFVWGIDIGEGQGSTEPFSSFCAEYKTVYIVMTLT